MAGVNGKGKGSAFERKICVLLSMWVSELLRQDLFWRSAMSGGRATVMRKKGASNTSQGGDISAVDILGMPLTTAFSIECKFYACLDMDNAVYTGKGKIIEHWKQTLRDAEASGKLPMMVTKENRRNILVCFDATGAKLFRDTTMHGKRLAFLPQSSIHIYNIQDLLHVPYKQIAPLLPK